MKNHNEHSASNRQNGHNHHVTRYSTPSYGLSRGRQTMRGYAVKQAIIKLKCETHMSNQEIAKAIGRTPQWVSKVWRHAVKEAEQASISPEQREALKAWLIHQIKMTIIKAQSKVDDHAAYGALVLKGVEQLHALLGLDSLSDEDSKRTLQEITDRLDIRSPLVMEKLRGHVPKSENRDHSK
ncbi:hypothetical protein JO972_08520 [Verrucomicrobiaceae bacterium 5K15]|uniref:Uncharacterized protein n=1 Tax=Oceaniferula flava TaxID=2800421 RepID=A0AAE2SB89_9BACT|nr:hypothetical protein [Oceaniferula flavus]MBK1855001.1 hypothetical protein [Oceaniferula flavus]MBM1136307.1 hypothetical protein [Oceaniferula flavus]